MNFFTKGIAAGLMGVLMTGTGAESSEVAVINTKFGDIELEFLSDVAPWIYDSGWRSKLEE